MQVLAQRINALTIGLRRAECADELAQHLLNLPERNGLKTAYSPECLTEGRKGLSGSFTARREVIDIGCSLVALQARGPGGVVVL